MAIASTRQATHEAKAFATLADPVSAKRKVPALRRALTDPRFAIRMIKHMLNLPMRLETEDRRVLEEVIFPFYQNDRICSILFVGCDWYTKHYERSFFADVDFWTIDPDPKARKFAGKRHVVAPLERLNAFFGAGRFDVIFCNGVYGCGLNAHDACERAFDMCRTALVPGGHFILGWDDIEARRPVPLESIASLKQFERFAFPALGTSHYLTDTPYRHIYDFFRAPGVIGSADPLNQAHALTV